MWRYLNKFLGKNIESKNNWCQNGTKICSQLVREYVEDCGFKNLFIGFGKGSVSPQDVYSIVLAHPELFELLEKKG